MSLMDFLHLLGMVQSLFVSRPFFSKWPLSFFRVQAGIDLMTYL